MERRRPWMDYGCVTVLLAVVVVGATQNWKVALGSIGLYASACGILYARDRWMEAKSRGRW